MTTPALIGLAAAGVAFLLFLIIVVRIQAFVALLVTSIAVAVIGGVPLAEIADNIRNGMGSTLGYIAIVVGVGAMFGEMLQVSGGAEQIARTLLDRFSEKRAPWALVVTGLIVSTPVFFDVALILFIPLVYSLTQRTGKSLLYFGIPLTAGMAIAHAFIPPTPGPVAVAALLHADLGWVIFFGALTGTPAAILGGILFGRYISDKVHLGVPDHLAAQTPPPEERGQTRLPSFGIVITLVAVPIILILLNTASDLVLPGDSPVAHFLQFIGHPFTALILTALLSFYFLGKRMGYSGAEIERIASKSLEPVGLVILVTGAGGVFGQVLIATGIGEALAQIMAASSLPFLLLAFVIAMLVRISQGSATVSMITAAGLMAPIVQTGSYSQPVLALVTIAIAAGATTFSHVNDSGFWLVSRFFGMTTEDTLRSWSVMMVILGFSGLGFCFILSLFV
ncbi:MAG TPA: gluconate:H+ symporter [Rhodothermales bacterium]|nr:gluconate:H+ symporter [Rhodothermales bacterium]